MKHLNNITINQLEVFGVKIDNITLDQAVGQVEEWVKKGGKHYIVTPNIEFIMAAKKDAEFRQILNESDLCLPDSARFNWVKAIVDEDPELLKRLPQGLRPFAMTVRRLLIWPFFFLPGVKILPSFPITTGTDLMDSLLSEADNKSYKIGIIGGAEGLAEKVGQRYLGKKDYPQIVFTDSNIRVDKDGNTIKWERQNDILKEDLDILFVGLGQVKQEKWIAKNRDKIPAKVFIGVGGAIDYLSGSVARAPLFMRRLGLEWLFRLIIQPWRVKRFGEIVKFVFLMLIRSEK